MLRERPRHLNTVFAGAALVVAVDGFDTQSVAFVAPALREAWQIPPELFGPLFGAGLLGTLIGSIALGSLADRFGRKPMLLLSTGLFGIMFLKALGRVLTKSDEESSTGHNVQKVL